MANTFKVIFNGQILPGQDSIAVEQALIEQLKLPAEQVHAWFNGQADFSRDHLDFVTANRYRRRFKKAGALCHVLPMLVCPHCQRRQRQAEQCRACQKPLVPEQPDAVNQNDPVVQGDQQRLRRAVQSLSMGLLLLLSSFVLDSYLLQMGLDWYWLYAITVPLFAFGCGQLAVYKGYAFSLGALLGVTLSLGLAILILIPDRAHPERRIDRKAQLGAAALIFLSALWLWQKGSEQVDLDGFSQASQLLQVELRGATGSPEEILVPVEAHVLHGLALADQHTLRPHQAKVFGDALFQPISVFFIRLQALQFEQAHAQGEILPEFQYKAIRSFQLALKTRLDPRFQALIEQQPVLKHSYQSWFMANHEPRHEILMMQLNEAFIRLMQSSMFFYADKQRMPESLEELKDYAPLRMRESELFSIELSAPYQYTLHLSPKNEELAGKTLVLGAYVTTQKRFRRETKRLNLKRIGGDLPGKYLLSLSALNDWVMLGQH
ncbi:MAG: hypothetical protein AAF512_01295 [Pseudomonadota bacterium]